LKTVDKLVKICSEKGLRISVAESCTGGLVCSAITSVPGSSLVFDRGFITYSPESKTELLNVPESLIKDKGTVSKEVVTEMAIGAIKNSNADIAISMCWGAFSCNRFCSGVAFGSSWFLTKNYIGLAISCNELRKIWQNAPLENKYKVY